VSSVVVSSIAIIINIFIQVNSGDIFIQVNSGDSVSLFIFSVKIIRNVVVCQRKFLEDGGCNVIIWINQD